MIEGIIACKKQVLSKKKRLVITCELKPICPCLPISTKHYRETSIGGQNLMPKNQLAKNGGYNEEVV